MRKLFYASLVMALGIALGACAEKTPTESGEAQPARSTAPTSTTKAGSTSPSAASTPTQQPNKPSAASQTLPLALDPIREYLAGQLSMPADQITLVGWQAVTWRDSCLGVHKAKEGCADVITPGYTFKFQTGSNTSVLNTDATGRYYRLASKAESPAPLPALSWIRTGGIAGVCQSLSIYSTGAYWLTDCNTGEILSQGVAQNTDQTYLEELFNKYSSFEWKSTPPAGSADMFNDQIKFYGTGSQAMTQAEQQKLDGYLATVASGLEKAGK